MRKYVHQINFYINFYPGDDSRIKSIVYENRMMQELTSFALHYTYGTNAIFEQ